MDASHDRGEWNTASAFFWSQFQAGRVVIVAEQPSSGQIVRLTPADLDGVPLLYTSTGNLSYLQPRHPAYPRIYERFGAPGRIQLLVEAVAVRRLAKRARAERRKQAARAQSGSDARLGRPAKVAQVIEAIRQVIERGRWRAPQSMKALTNEVNRLDRSLQASDTTVRRALDSLYEGTGDRRYQRAKQRRPVR